MQLTSLLTLFIALAAAAPAPAAEELTLEARQSVIRVQFELERDTTFIQREISAGGGVFNRNGLLFSAQIVSGPSNARCQAFNGNTAVGGAIVPGLGVVYNNRNGAFITQVRC